MTLLSVKDLGVRRGVCDVLQGISFDIRPGEFVGLIGPNGAGKTTLMRAVLGLLEHSGHSSLEDMTEAARAKSAAWMPQAREIAWPVAVEDVVMLGRLPHRAGFAGASEADQAHVETALEQMELLPMRRRAATQLSGGEQARVLIARALAQDTPLLIADEPIAGLDPAHQIATMQTFRSLAEAGKSCLVSLHDLGLAVRHCTRLILLGRGGLIADGRPEDVMTPARMEQVFGITTWYECTDAGAVFQPLDVIRGNAPGTGKTTGA